MLKPVRINHLTSYNLLLKVSNHLIDGGKIYMLNPKDYYDVVHNLAKDCVETQTHIWEKRAVPIEIPKPQIKLWLQSRSGVELRPNGAVDTTG